MKKYLLFLSMCLLSLGMYAQDASTAIPWDWDNGANIGSAGTYLYKISLGSDVVPTGDDLLITLNNPSDDEITMTVQVYTLRSNGVTLDPIADAETRVVAAHRSYAKTISSGLFRAYDAVYMSLKVDKPVAFNVEPVEPGEVEVDCKNAVAFNFAGTNLAAGKEQWYSINVADYVSDPTKTLKITVTNQSSTETATINAGLATACPAYGVTEQTITLAAGKSKSKTLERSYFKMVQDGVVYIRVKSNTALKITAVEEAVTTVTKIQAEAPFTDIAPETEYTTAIGATWYRVKVADFNQKSMTAELTLSNGTVGAAKMKAEVVYSTAEEEPIVRNYTLGKGAIQVREIERDLIKSAASAATDGYVYVRITSDQAVKFSVRLKGSSEGNVCGKAKNFVWSTETDPKDNLQTSATEQWYAIAIADAKAATDKDIMLTLENKSSKKTAISAKLAMTCDYKSTQDFNYNLKAGVGEKVEKRIVWSNYGYYSDVDTVYVFVSTEQNINIQARLVDQEAFTEITECSEATEITVQQFTEGFTIPENTTNKWYWINIVDFIEDDKVPEVTIRNNGSAPVKVTGELAYECPVKTAMQSKTITVTSTYTKTPSLEMLSQIDGSKTEKLYFRVNTVGGEVTVQGVLKYENEGAACATAKEFNMSIGEYQGENDTVWYHIDLNAIRTTGKDLRLVLTNTDTKKVNVHGLLSYECKVDMTPQAQSTSVNKNDSIVKTISAAAIKDNKATEAWLRLVTNGSIHIQARYQDAVPENICDRPFADFVWEEYNDVAATDTAWFKVSLAPLKEAGKETYAPRLYVNNEANTTETKLWVEVSFDCANAARTSKSKTVAAGKEIDELIERDQVNQYTDNDYAYIGIVASQAVKFKVVLEDPNQGQDCSHAVAFDWENGHIQNAGGVVTWYKVDLTAAKADTEHGVEIGVRNLDGTKGKVAAELYYECGDGSEPFQTYEYTLGANARKTTKLGHAAIANMEKDYVFIRLTTYQQDSIFAVSYELSDEKITACADAIELHWNVDVEQVAGEQWYWLDLKTLKANLEDNTTDSVLLVIEPNAAYSSNKIIAAGGYTCPMLKDDMLDKTISYGANGYRNGVTNKYVKSLTADSVFVRINTEHDITFRIETADKQGKYCDSAIPFDWANGNTYYQVGDTTWYVMNLDTLINYPENVDRGLKIFAHNLTADDATATIFVMTDCGGEIKYTNTASMAGDATNVRHLSHAAAIAQVDNHNDIRLAVVADKSVHVWAVLDNDSVVEAFGPDTTEYYCAGTSNYSYKVQYQGDTTTVEHTGILIDVDTCYLPYKDAATQQFYWEDTIVFVRDYTVTVDSIVKHYVLPIVTPTSDELPLISGITAKAGAAIDYTAANDAIIAALKAMASETSSVDTTALSVEWQYDLDGSWATAPTGKLPKEMTDITLRYRAHVGTTCADLGENIINSHDTLLLVELREYRKDSVGVDGVCAGLTYPLRSNPSFVIAGDTLIYDTVAVTTEALDFDSVYVYNFVNILPVINIDGLTLTSAIDAQIGKTLSLSAIQAELVDSLTARVAPVDLVYDDITWQWEENSTYVAFDSAAVGKLNTELTTLNFRYIISTQCSTEPIYSDPIAVDVAAKAVVEKDSVQRVCLNEVIDGVTIANDTTFSRTTNIEISDIQDADSVITYTITYFRTPDMPTLTAPEVHCGEAVVVTSLEDDIKAHFQTFDETYAHMDEEAGIVWKLRNGEATEDFVADQLLSTRTQVVTLFYTVTTTCGETLTGDDIVINVVQDCDQTAMETIDAIVCEGGDYQGRVTYLDAVTAAITFYDTIYDSYVNAAGRNADSVYVHNITLYNVQTEYPTLEDISADLKNPVCGEPMNLSDLPTQTVMDFMGDNAVAQDPTLSKVSTFLRWEVQVDGEWKVIDALNPNVDFGSEAGAVNVRFVVQDDCDNVLTSEPYLLMVDKPNTENSDNVDELPASEPKYGNRLLMIDLNAIIEKYNFTPEESDVRWYRVVGDIDTEFNYKDEPYDADGSEYNDELVATGYYLTNEDASALVGQYYALFSIPETAENPCGIINKTKVFNLSQNIEQVIKLAPSTISSGEELEILGLNEEDSYDVTIYNATGLLINRFEVENSATHRVKVDATQGYYMLNVTNQAGDTKALKFIVK